MTINDARIDEKRLLSVVADYNDLIIPQKGTHIIQNFVTLAIQNNKTTVSITLYNKESIQLRSTFSRITFVKLGVAPKVQESAEIGSLPYFHAIHGEGRIYPSIGDALKVHDLNYSKYRIRLKKPNP